MDVYPLAGETREKNMWKPKYFLARKRAQEQFDCFLNSNTEVGSLAETPEMSINEAQTLLAVGGGRIPWKITAR